MYALFASVPLHSHVTPLLRQAEELQRRGWRVGFADAGPLGSIGDRLHEAQAGAFDAGFVPATRRIERVLWEWWPSMYDEVARAIAADRPDVVVVDLMSSAAMAAAEAAEVALAKANASV